MEVLQILRSASPTKKCIEHEQNYQKNIWRWPKEKKNSIQ
jgi:hypothetical protein